MAIFRFFKMVAATMLDFENFEILSARMIKRDKLLRQQAKILR